MYCKLFVSLYQGTLRGQSHEILVFTNLLAHADAQGRVDKHFRAIADEVGLTVDEVRAAIEVLESPDPESRNPDFEGARLIRLDEHRVWGWKIVSYAKYRSIRNEEDRRTANREAQQRWRDKQRKKNVSTVSTVSPDKPKQKQRNKNTEGASKLAPSPPTRKAGSADFVTWDADSGFSGISEDHLKRWSEAYPALDLKRQIAAANEWLIVNPAKRKKRPGRFLVNWLGRAQERGGDVGSNKPESRRAQKAAKEFEQEIELPDL